MVGEEQLICQDVETDVIMEDKVHIPLLHQLVGEYSDGIVRVESSKVDGLNAFEVVHADHTLITCHPDVLRSIDRFLRQGVL